MTGRGTPPGPTNLPVSVPGTTALKVPRLGVTREPKCGQTLTMSAEDGGALKVSPGKKIKAGNKAAGGKKPFIAMPSGQGRLQSQMRLRKYLRTDLHRDTAGPELRGTNANRYPSGNQSSPLVTSERKS
jgi:hypothetical protein